MTGIPFRGSWIHALVLALSFSLLPDLSSANATPPDAVRRLLEKRGIPAGSVGLFVQEVQNPAPLLAYGAQQPLNPASVMKLVTTFVALDVLGPAYRWVTEAYVTGPIAAGRVAGDLVIRGTGDPYLVTENVWKFLRALRQRGVKDISGDLIVDNRFFVTEIENRSGFDRQPNRPYNAHPDALLVNFQTVRFLFSPDIAANKVRIVADPKPSNLTLDNRLTLTKGSCRGALYRLKMNAADAESGGRVSFSGKYPASCGHYALSRVVSDSSSFGLGVLYSFWQELGGSIGSRLRVDATPDNARRVYAMKSPPLADLIRSINKFSNNVMTRQLLLTLGAEDGGTPGTREKGRAAVSRWFAANQLAAPNLIVDNGAGLSRSARVSAQTLGSMLLKAYASPYMPEFVSSLPIAAVDGTLRDRFRREALAGRSHMKTGRLDRVRAIAGYVLSRSGRTFVVVSLLNHPRANSGVGQALNKALLRWVHDQ